MTRRVVYSPQAGKFLEKLAEKSPHTTRDILEKIEWLAENAEVIRHERLRGTRHFSLHSGQFRVLYLWDRAQDVIIIEIIDKNDAAYQQLDG